MKGSSVEPPGRQAKEMVEEKVSVGIQLQEMLEACVMGLEMPISFDILTQDDIWICDTGASNNGTKCKKGAVNVRQGGCASLGHSGKVQGT